MKVGILAGGLGSRLAEETEIRPKPMLEIGGKPILWHIMKHYSHFGHDDFVIALGYKGEYIKRYMADYAILGSGHMKVDMKDGQVMLKGSNIEGWTVELVDTGMTTQTGGRIKRLQQYMGNETFMLTWGDSVSTVDLDKLIAFHRAHGKLATLTAVRPPARYGHLTFEGDRITEFAEKPQTAEGWINGAFLVLEPKIFSYIADDTTQFEKEPLERLAADGQLMAYKHEGFWQCMDTFREKHILNELWNGGKAPWKLWTD